MGLPLDAAGGVGPQAAVTQAWASAVGPLVGLPIAWRDERHSSQMAEKRIGGAPRGRSGGPPSPAARRAHRARIDREAAAVLVAINAVFQILAFAALGYFYLELLPGWLGLGGGAGSGLDVSVWDIATSVLVFLGIPLAAGFLSRTLGERVRGRDWYESRFLPRIGPSALWGLLFTIVVLFALQGDQITSRPWDVARIALPLLAYFAVMWTSSFALGLRLGLPYDRNATVAFTAAGNNFELAIAVAIGVFGVTSGQALAGVVGPLIEVPVLVGLVYVALWARRRFYPAPPAGVVTAAVGARRR